LAYLFLPLTVADFRFPTSALQVAQLLRLRMDIDMRERLGKLPLGQLTAYDDLYEQI
jgi:hypothetical protein